MTFWNLNSISAALGASPVDTSITAQGVSIDTRTLKPGQLFVAIKGPTFDAHDFLHDAADNHASALIINNAHAAPTPNIPTIRVPDTLAALHQLTSAYRKTLTHARIVAITGSNGKTTTCRLTHAALSDPRNTVCPRDSFNNHIGVPLTILNAPAHTHTIICELGTSSPGEIAFLSNLIQPDIVAITSISCAHAQGLGSLENIIKEKCSILSGLQSSGTLLLPHEHRDHINDPRAQTIGSTSHAAHTYNITSATPTSTSFLLDPLGQLTIPIPGNHNAHNAATAAIIAHTLGTPADSIRQGLSGAEPPPMRLALHHFGPYTLINDAYNANPDSTLAALRTFPALCPDASRRVLIFGDMLELGDLSQQAHTQIGHAIARAKHIDVLITVGDHSQHAAIAAQTKNPSLQTAHFNNLDDTALTSILNLLLPNDAILLKASRSMRLERIEHALREKHSTPVVVPLHAAPST